MDKERTTRDLKRTKRQQRALSSVHRNSSSRTNQLSVLCNGGGGEVDLLERCKKERSRGSRGSSSDDGVMGCGGSDGEEEPRPALATTTSSSSRKRVRLHRKVLDDYNAVDPATVPRKLRSAINKRSSESASPPLPDAKKCLHSSNGIMLPNFNAVKRSKQNKMQDPLTKDEEEVAETLFALAKMSPPTEHVKNGIDRKVSEEKSDSKTTTSAPLSEASKEETVKIPFPTIMEATNVSSCVDETFEEAVKIQSLIETTVLAQTTTVSRNKHINLEPNGTTEENLESIVPLLKNESLLSPNDAKNLSNPVGSSLEIHSANGVLPTRQLKALSLQKPEIGLLQVKSAAIEQEVQHVKENSENIARLAYPEEATLDIQPEVPGTRGHLTWPSPAKNAVWLDSASCASRPCSNENDHSTEKIDLVSADRRPSWKKCATHVYISHIIQNYQNAVKTPRCTLPANHMKHKEGIRLGVVAANDPVGLKNGISSIASVGAHGASLERDQHEARVGVLHDTRLQPDLQASTSSGPYSQQKPNQDFLSMSAGCKSSNSGNGVESSRQLPVPYLHPLAPHHPLMQFSIPPGGGRYSSPYPDQLAAAAVQQVQFQLPHYLGNPIYGLHMGQVGGSTKQQQQQMWQAYYRPLSGIPKWQSGRPHDTSPSLIPCVQPPPEHAVLPSPPADLLGGGGSHHSAADLQQYQHASVPSSASSRVRKHHQRHHQSPHTGGSDEVVGIFQPDGASQLQFTLQCPAHVKTG